MSLRVSACLPASIMRKYIMSNLHLFLCTLPTIAGARFSGGVAILYVLPVFMDDVILAYRPYRCSDRVTSLCRRAQSLLRRVGCFVVGAETRRIDESVVQAVSVAGGEACSAPPLPGIVEGGGS